MRTRFRLALAAVAALALLSSGLGCSGSSGSGTADKEDEAAKAKDAKVQAALEGAVNVGKALQKYHVDHDSTWPASLDLLTVRGSEGGPYLDPEGLIDPWGKPYQFDPSGPKNKGKRPDVFTTGPGGERIGNWEAIAEEGKPAPDKTGTVVGKVTYKGQPLAAGMVLFVPERDKSKGYSGAIQADGTYRVQKVPVGESRVMIETDPPARPLKDSKKYIPAPPKYADLKATPLRLEVKPGEQEHDIKLTD
jgi:hypothetical protein